MSLSIDLKSCVGDNISEELSNVLSDIYVKVYPSDGYKSELPGNVYVELEQANFGVTRFDIGNWEQLEESLNDMGDFKSIQDKSRAVELCLKAIEKYINDIGSK